jgi:hypothetical protein
MVKPTVRYYLPTAFSPVGGEAHACDPHAVCLAMEEYVMNSKLRAEHGDSAKMTVNGYTWYRACATLVKRLHDEKQDQE